MATVHIFVPAVRGKVRVTDRYAFRGLPVFYLASLKTKILYVKYTIERRCRPLTKYVSNITPRTLWYAIYLLTK